TITRDVCGHLVEGDRRAVAASMSQEVPRAETNTPSIGWGRGRQCWPCLCGGARWRGLCQGGAPAQRAGPPTTRTTSPQPAVVVLMSGASRDNSRNPTL